MAQVRALTNLISDDCTVHDRPFDHGEVGAKDCCG
jgi:hypothetical protein